MRGLQTGFSGIPMQGLHTWSPVVQGLYHQESPPVPASYCRGELCFILLCNHILLTVQLKQWTGLFFGRTTLKKLGLRIQLGHAPGRYCTSFVEGNKDFVVIHTNGIHTVQFEFCGCTDVPAHIQLLRISWYPATPLQPQTCATLDALRQFHFLNLQGKTTGYSYY